MSTTFYAGRLKRCVDVAVAALLCLLLAPLLLLIAAIIKCDSRGPVLFKQARVGRDGTRFRIVKFRTMTHRAPDEIDQFQEAVITAGADARITRVGRLLRRTSLDELPQLLNILKGEMSLIGPRPVLPEQLKAMQPGDMERFRVRPGVTGLAQVNGRRSLSWPDQLRYDVEYARSCSARLDAAILFKTVLVVFGGGGVYGDESANWRNYLPRE